MNLKTEDEYFEDEPDWEEEERYYEPPPADNLFEPDAEPAVKTLRRVGSFQELGDFTAHALSLRDVIADHPHPEENLIVAYLGAGVVFIKSKVQSRDALDPRAGITLPRHIITDGEYCWTADLSYYVAKYHVRLPDIFLDHMRDEGWKVRPALIDINRLALE